MFEIGKEYKRSEIHDKYNGSRQSGISPSASHPLIFIFTSDSGEQFGYKDEYHNGIFMYTGEGQTGDMKMNRGNSAIRDHAKEGRTLHVFESTRKAHVSYIGSAEYLGHHEETRLDRNNLERIALVFHLEINSIPPADQVSDPKPLYGPMSVKDLGKKDIAGLREAALCSSPESATLTEKKKVIYYRSEALKLYVILRSHGICEGCGEDAPFHTKKGPFLECHHIHRVADGGPDHPKNVIALCPNCHRRAHYANDATEYNNKLKNKALKIESLL
jgi:5-methylcytosine-specific restriction protein A